GILLSDNRGKPIHPRYKNFSLSKIQKVREDEQKKAALLGEYAGLCFLRYPSAFIRNTRYKKEVEAAVKRLIEKIKPSVIYTHSLTDKHPTHRAAACRVIGALKRTAPDKRPEYLYGIGVWGGLDWLPDSKRKAFDVSGYEELASKLLKAYKSQMFGLHRYDAAVLSRRRANAIFHRSRGFSKSSSIIYAMELTSLINNPKLTIKKYLKSVANELYKNSSAI
ncbi:MAG: PIG-L family deacetylase, partial [Candidatus Omnitrophica bacterium]|nr:PIG-L family deacetylase [Candidatus Omnitrophota bacterium]